MVCLKIEEGAAYGAALQALWTIEGGELGNITDRLLKPDESTRLHPDPSRVALYKRHQSLFNNLGKDLRGAFAAHRALLALK